MPRSRDHTVVLVIGAGVAGLTAAIRLRERGFDVAVRARQRSPELVSDRAAAIFSPYRVADDPRVRDWCRSSLTVFREHAAAGVADGAVRLRPTREYFPDHQPDVPWWHDVVDEFRRLRDLPPGYADGFEARLPHIDMTRYMPWLERRLCVELGAVIETAAVTSLDSLPQDTVIVNCTGLGAGELAGDDSVYPIRGQLLHVPNDIDLDVGLFDQGHDRRLTYLFPFEDHIVLGGTYERGEVDARPRDEDLEGVLQRCRDLLVSCGHPAAGRLGTRIDRRLAGLRPGRGHAAGNDACVRLDLETRSNGRRVVHDYGHGGAGVTLSWGCAAEVVRLVEGASSSARGPLRQSK